MKIAIFGAGNVGGTLGSVWVRKGHEVFFGVPDPKGSKTQQLLKSIGVNARAGSIAEAAANSEVVVIATPWPATQEAIKSAGSLSGKVVIDCTNPLKPDLSGLAIGHTTSAAEQVAEWARGAKVFKAFNQTGSNNMADPVFGDQRAVMFVCGDDAAHKPTVLGLVRDIGFDAIDAGNLVVARLLEPYAMLWIHLALNTNQGRNFAFGLLTRKGDAS